VAAKARPDYFDAHCNLGSAFARHEGFHGAGAEFRAAVRFSSKDANAEDNLEGALAAVGDFAEAKLTWRALPPQSTKCLGARESGPGLQELPH
jgi:Flp pilus assembly protein TadD